MIKPESIAVIKATVPVLQKHGEALTRLFYQRMFENNPEVKVFFNQAHQHAGSQQRALAAAVCAYAENIDNPGVLADAVELIAQKHASLGIQPEHYPIVGQNLLAAIKELLGEAATDAIIDAWAEAYQALATIFIEREQAIYQQHQMQHGWQGFKAFKVINSPQESDNIRSFYLQPEDGSTIVAHQPGQYITVKVDNGNGQQLRNYSLSNLPGSDAYRISVKRETSGESTHPHGVVSSFLHEHINDGDTIWLGPPCGEFVLRSNRDTPVVLIAGGVGITPLLAMLHERVSNDVPATTTLIQAAVNGDAHAFADEIRSLTSAHPQLSWHVRYSDPSEQDRKQGSFDSEGLIDDELVSHLDTAADYYLCGPIAMMKQCYQLLTEAGIPAEQIFSEAFGPAHSLQS
jgi:nitric oxide dioxygenase